MSDPNKRNILYFESDSMRSLYETMDKWQVENNKRLLSLNIQADQDNYCCIALTNPTEVIIFGNEGGYTSPMRQVNVSNNKLLVSVQ